MASACAGGEDPGDKRAFHWRIYDLCWLGWSGREIIEKLWRNDQPAGDVASWEKTRLRQRVYGFEKRRQEVDRPRLHRVALRNEPRRTTRSSYRCLSLARAWWKGGRPLRREAVPNEGRQSGAPPSGEKERSCADG